MTRMFILAILLLMPAASHALAWLKPLPREFTGNEYCLPYQFFETADAEMRVSWCRTDDPVAAGQWAWRVMVWQWCLKAKCKTPPSGGGFSAWKALDDIKNAADPVAVLSALAAQLRIVPTATEQTQLDILWSRACKSMSTAPFPGGPPQGWTPGWVFPADYCPPEPAPPPPPVTQYVVTVAQAFPLKADGTRSITVWPQPAVIGEAADGTVKVIQFGATFCKVPRLSTAQTTVVAGCRVKP